MKTNVLKSTVLFAALSLAFTACQKDSLVTEMETGLKKKEVVDVEQIRPDKNHNDRELERDLSKELPVRKEATPSSSPSVSKESDTILHKKEARPR